MLPKAIRSLPLFIATGLVLAACATPSPESTPDTPQPTEIAAAFDCSDSLGCLSIAMGDPIHIAWMQATTGALGHMGTTNVRAAELALNEIGFELLGHPIQWDGEDSLCTPEGGKAAGARFADDPSIIAIFGPTCAPEALGALPLISGTGLVMVSSSITHPDLTNPDSSTYWDSFLRTAHNDVFQGRVAAEFAYNELNLSSAATIYDSGVYSMTLQQAFATKFRELGGTVTAQVAMNPDSNPGGVLAELAAGAPQLIYFPVFEPLGIQIAAQKCETPGLENTQMMSGDSLLSSTFPGAAGPCSVGTFLTGTFVDPGVQSAFLASYSEQFGASPASSFAPHSYDAVKMILAAIEQVAVLDDAGTLQIPRQAFRDALYATSGLNGLTGTLTCTASGDCASGQALAVFQVTQENADGSADLLTHSPIWWPGQQ